MYVLRESENFVSHASPEWLIYHIRILNGGAPTQMQTYRSKSLKCYLVCYMNKAQLALLLEEIESGTLRTEHWWRGDRLYILRSCMCLLVVSSGWVVTTITETPAPTK